MKPVDVCTVSTGGTIHGDISVGGTPRYASLSQEDCVRHAQAIYKETGEHPDIFVVSRIPVDHTAKQKKRGR